MKKGGYQIIDLGAYKFTNGESQIIPNVYNIIKNTKKVVLISGLTVDDTEYHDMFTVFIPYETYFYGLTQYEGNNIYFSVMDNGNFVVTIAQSVKEEYNFNSFNGKYLSSSVYDGSEKKEDYTEFSVNNFPLEMVSYYSTTTGSTKSCTPYNMTFYANDKMVAGKTYEIYFNFASVSFPNITSEYTVSHTFTITGVKKDDDSFKNNGTFTYYGASNSITCNETPFVGKFLFDSYSFEEITKDGKIIGVHIICVPNRDIESFYYSTSYSYSLSSAPRGNAYTEFNSVEDFKISF